MLDIKIKMQILALKFLNVHGSQGLENLQRVLLKDDEKRQTFNKGERAIAFYQYKFYDSKAVEVKKDSKGVWNYLIHFYGWKNRHNEWMTGMSIFKCTPAMIEMYGKIEKYINPVNSKSNELIVKTRKGEKAKKY